jgi:hypothetical protein
MALKIALCVALGLSLTTPASAATPAGAATLIAPINRDIVPVAQGCGPGWYRGPGGACHRFGYGPGPGWGWGGPGWRAPGYWGGRHCWRGPYGGLHCN